MLMGEACIQASTSVEGCSGGTRGKALQNLVLGKVSVSKDQRQWVGWHRAMIVVHCIVQCMFGDYTRPHGYT